MRSSLRTRLILTFIGLITIPLLLVGIVFIQRSFAMQSAQALVLQAQVAQKAAAEIRAFVDAREDDLRLLTDVRGFHLLEQTEQIQLLDGLLTKRAEYEEMTLLDSQGNELLRRQRLGTVERLGNRAGLPEFEQPKATGTTYYSPIEIDEFGEPFITIALPLLDLRSSALSNVLVAKFRFKTIWKLTSDVSTGGQTVYIVDEQGRVVAHPNPSVILQGRQFDLAAEDSFTTGLDGSRVAQAMARIPLGKETLVVVAEQPVSTALNLTYNIIFLTISAVVLGLLAATGLGVAAARRIVQPVEILAETAQTISNGDLSLKADVNSKDEIGQLAETFNRMTSQLKETIDSLNQRILEQQQAEADLRASEATNRALLDAVPDAIFQFDQDGTFLEYIPAQAFKTIVSPEEFLGKTIEDVLPPDLARQTRHHLDRLLQTGEGQIYEYTMSTDGKPRYFEARQVVSGDNKVLAIVRDITGRVETEMEREKLISELETKNAELTQFTYTVSHDLKSPLVTINGYLGYLEQDAMSGDMERLKKDTQRIQEAANKMHALLTELLELSRIGRMMNEPVDIPFDDLVKDTLDLAHGQIEKHKVAVQVQPNLPIVHGDRQRLTEVLQNLIDNAAKHMGDQTDPQIEIGQQGDEDGKPIFFVKDNGIGIAPEYHEQIFGLFNKLDSQSEGTGIGLTLVKRIVEVHGGRIWVESEGISKGSTFYFTLPTE